MRRLFVACVLAALAGAPAARAAEHEVKMLTKGPEGQLNWFDPPITHAEPGDTIHFVATDKGHNSTSLVVPEGGETWNGKINNDVSVTLTVPGLYAYKCTPHFGLGMTGLIAVGDPSVNLKAVEDARYPGRAKATMAKLLEQLKASM
jgi:pseudoazurin